MSKPLTYSYQPCDLVVGSSPTSATFHIYDELKSNATCCSGNILGGILVFYHVMVPAYPHGLAGYLQT